MAKESQHLFTTNTIWIGKRFDLPRCSALNRVNLADRLKKAPRAKETHAHTQLQRFSARLQPKIHSAVR